MVNTIHPVDATAGSPSYSGRMLRQTSSVAFAGASSSRPFGVSSGVRPGTSPGTVFADATTWYVYPHGGLLDFEAAAESGPTAYAIDATVSGAMRAADTFARIDIVWVRQDIPLEDGSAAPAVVPGYTYGTSAGVVPAAPARCMVLAQVNVPASGGGAPTITWVAPYLSAAGGIMPVPSSSSYPSASASAGLSLYDIALKSVLVSDGTAWNPIGGATPGGRVKRSATAGTFGAGTWTVNNNPTFWAVDQPAAGIGAFDGLWTATYAGVYEVEAGIQLDAAVSAILVVKKNSLTADAAGSVAAVSVSGVSGFTGATVRARVRLVSGDTIAHALYVSAAAPWTTSVPDSSFLGVRYVEPLR